MGKGTAQAAWKLIKRPAETLELILRALEWQKVSETWTKSAGQFIPHPATYLRGQRWMDEPTAAGSDESVPPETEEHRRIRENLERLRSQDDKPNREVHDDF